MKRPKRPRDPSQLAKLIVDLSTGRMVDESAEEGKSISAVRRGRKGGHIGGKRRMQALSAADRTALARAAANARWRKRD